MGNECACSNIDRSNIEEIVNQKHQRRTSLPEEQIPKAIEGDSSSESSSCNLGEDSCEKSEYLDLETLQHTIEDNESDRKSKKMIHIMPPKKEMEEENDNMTIISEQIPKIHFCLITKALQNHFIFSQLKNEELVYLISKMRYCKTEKQSYIFKQGDPSWSYYVIVKGECIVEINGEKKKKLIEGQTFGDLGIIYYAPRSASIYSENECILAELNSKNFRQILEDLNSMSEQENRQLLETVEFYKNLNEVQKNVLASNCVTETYQSGQIIFNKGDDANAFYLIKDGAVTIVEKNKDLGMGESIGVNAVMSNESSIRSNTIVAKTDCKLLSLTREIILNNLGSDVMQLMRQNLVMKIIKESILWKMFTPEKWAIAVQSMTEIKFSKNDIVIKKGTRNEPFVINILLSTDAVCNNSENPLCYLANYIIEIDKVSKRKEVIFEEDFEAKGEGYLVKICLSEEECLTKIKEKAKEKIRSLTIDAKSGLLLKDFVVLKKLRSGNFGKVYACYNKKTCKKYAIKVMNKEAITSSNVLSYIIQEEEILKTIPEHPFIVKFHSSFHDENFIMLVMDLLEGEDMFDAINSKLPLTEGECKFLASQLFLIVEHLHINKIIYRDLKPENVMLNMDGYLTLVDMGTAKRLTIEDRYRTSTIIGTPHYMAPEIILGKGYTFTVDWWSLGVMVYEMIAGKLPYGESIDDPYAVYQEILRIELNFPLSITSSAKDLLAKLLVKNSEKRLRNGSAELRRESFFKDLSWEKLLKKQYKAKILPDVSCEISAEELKEKLDKKPQTAYRYFMKDRDKKIIK